MIIAEIEVEEATTIGNVKSRTLSMDAGSLPFVFDMVSTKFYSDPIGSIVREITSNCYDANIESGSDKPIVINVSKDEENDNWYIEFCDSGLGLSEVRMDEVFMGLFTSTKRQSNDFIGGFGIGSKSPFAYTDSVGITTVNNGIKYEYLFYKNGALPDLDLLSSYVTDEPSGTKVRIDIRNDSDFNDFCNACNNQLAYFDSVYINSSRKNFFNNEYKIYEGDNFKFRLGAYDELHIVIENVKYPIDFRQVPIPAAYRQIEVALKFKVGELDITPNREQLQYTDRTKAAIQAKFEALKIELKEMYEKQNQPVDDLVEFWAKLNSDTRIKVNEGVSFSIPKILASTSIKYKPFIDLDIQPLVFMNWEVENLSDGKLKKGISSIQPRNLSRYYYTSAYPDKWNCLFHQNGYLLSEIKITNAAKWDKRYEYVNWCKLLGLTGKSNNKAKTILAWKKHVREYVKSKTRVWNVVTEQWIAEWKAENQVREKTNKEIVNVKVDGVKHQFKVEDLAKYQMVFCYGKDEDHRDKLKFIERWRGYKKCIAIEVNKTNIYKMRYLTNLVDCDDLINVPQLQNYYQKTKIATQLKGYVRYYNNWTRISKYYKDVYGQIRDFVSKHYYDNNYQIDGFLDPIVVNPVKHYDMLKCKQEIEYFFKKIKPLEYLKDECPIEYVKLFIKQIHLTKIDDEFRS